MRPVFRLIAIICSVPLLVPVAADAAPRSGAAVGAGGGFARGGSGVRSPGFAARPSRAFGGFRGSRVGASGPGRGTCFFGPGCGTPGPGFGPGYGPDYGLAFRGDSGAGRDRRSGRTGYGYGGYGGGGGAVGLAYDGFGYGAAGGFMEPGPVYGTPPSPVSPPAIYVIGRSARQPARARTGSLGREPGGVRVVSLSEGAKPAAGRIIVAPR